MGDYNARSFAGDWIDSFNAKDIDRILSHYAEGITLVSPAYLRFTEGRRDVVDGKVELRDFFKEALRMFPQLHFDLLEVGEGARGICIRYRTSLGDRVVMESFELDSSGRAARAWSHYVVD